MRVERAEPERVTKIYELPEARLVETQDVFRLWHLMLGVDLRFQRGSIKGDTPVTKLLDHQLSEALYQQWTEPALVYGMGPASVWLYHGRILLAEHTGDVYIDSPAAYVRAAIAADPDLADQRNETGLRALQARLPPSMEQLRIDLENEERRREEQHRREEAEERAEFEALLAAGQAELNANSGRERRRVGIPERVRNEVWRRDQGRCVECGSQERLEFDHIIPWSKGGSDTARNLRLLCELCNRRKSDQI